MNQERVRVLFRPSEGVEEYEFARTPVDIGLKFNRKMLSDALNTIGKLDPQISFDFKVDGHFLRTSLSSALKMYEISSEKVVIIEYFPLFQAPKPDSEAESEDWISQVRVTDKTIMYSQYDGSVRNLEKNVYQQAYEKPAKCFCSNGDLTITGYLGGKIAVSSQSGAFFATTHQGSTNTLDSSESHPFLFVSGGSDRCLSLWRVEKESLNLLVPFPGHDDSVNQVRWRDCLYSCSSDCSIKLWDIEKQEHIQTINTTSPVLTLDIQNDLIVSGHSDRSARAFDRRMKTNKLVIETFKSHSNWVSSLVFCGDHVFASASYDGSVKIWNIGTNVPLYTIVQNDEKVFSIDYNRNLLVFGGTGKVIRTFIFD